jgi:hypothetical protein
MEIRKILEGLDQWQEEEIPENLLLAAVKAKDEIIPDLIVAIEDVAKNPAKYAQHPERQLYYWAIYLLTFFDATEAFSAALNFFKLNTDEFSTLVADIIDEDGAMILADLCGGNIDPICEMLQDTKASESNRCAAAIALGFLCVWGEIDAARIEAEYRRALETLDKNSDLLAMELVNGATDLNLRGLAPDVTKAFDRGVIHDDDFEFAAEWLHDPDFEAPPPYMLLTQGIDDIVDFFEQKLEEERLMDDALESDGENED